MADQDKSILSKDDKSPGSSIQLVTPSDAADFQVNGVDRPCRAISFAVAGAISIVDLLGNTTIIPEDALVAGSQHAIWCQRINATGTTATGIVAYF